MIPPQTQNSGNAIHSGRIDAWSSARENSATRARANRARANSSTSPATSQTYRQLNSEELNAEELNSEELKEDLVPELNADVFERVAAILDRQFSINSSLYPRDALQDIAAMVNLMSMNREMRRRWDASRHAMTRRHELDMTDVCAAVENLIMVLQDFEHHHQEEEEKRGDEQQDEDEEDYDEDDEDYDEDEEDYDEYEEDYDEDEDEDEDEDDEDDEDDDEDFNEYSEEEKEVVTNAFAKVEESVNKLELRAEYMSDSSNVQKRKSALITAIRDCMANRDIDGIRAALAASFPSPEQLRAQQVLSLQKFDKSVHYLGGIIGNLMRLAEAMVQLRKRFCFQRLARMDTHPAGTSDGGLVELLKLFKHNFVDVGMLVHRHETRETNSLTIHISFADPSQVRVTVRVTVQNVDVLNQEYSGLEDWNDQGPGQLYAALKAIQPKETITEFLSNAQHYSVVRQFFMRARRSARASARPNVHIADAVNHPIRSVEHWLGRIERYSNFFAYIDELCGMCDHYASLRSHFGTVDQPHGSLSTSLSTSFSRVQTDLKVVLMNRRTHRNLVLQLSHLSRKSSKDNMVYTRRWEEKRSEEHTERVTETGYMDAVCKLFGRVDVFAEMFDDCESVQLGFHPDPEDLRKRIRDISKIMVEDRFGPWGNKNDKPLADLSHSLKRFLGAQKRIIHSRGTGAS